MNVVFKISMCLIWLLYLPLAYGLTGSKCVNGSYETLGIPEGKPEVEPLQISLDNIYVDDGVFIQCNVKANPKAKIWWSIKYVRKDVKRAFRFSDCNKTLEIHGAVNWHTGLYTCLAKNKYGESSSPETALEVKLKEKDQSWFKHTAVIEKNKSCLNLGDNVTLSCKENNSEGICSWYKNNKSISVIPEKEACERRCCLSIHNLTKDDEGVYKCYMYYDLRKGESTLNINKNDCDAHSTEKSKGTNKAGTLQRTVNRLVFLLLAKSMFF